MTKPPTNKTHTTTVPFERYQQLLQQERVTVPTLVLDLDRLDHNIAQLNQHWPANTQYRLVDKSLPCVELIDYILQNLTILGDSSGQNSTTSAMANHSDPAIMCFHLPALQHQVNNFPNSDILIGKPFPINAAEEFYRSFDASSRFDPTRQLHWLIDNAERLHQYLAVAKQNNQQLSICFEIDIGLRRGGITTIKELQELLNICSDHAQHIKVAGLMGYDAHVGKLPRFIERRQTSFDKSQHSYQAFINVILKHCKAQQIAPEKMIFNGAGSPTLEIHKMGSVCNDLSLGSALLKPSSFNLPTLINYQTACYIASPILKRINRFQAPGPRWLSRLVNPFNQPGFFIYGGGWRANAIHPTSIRMNHLFGYSANQAFLSGNKECKSQAGDFVFFSPSESEAILLQFEEILAVRNDQVIARWKTGFASNARP